MAINQITGLEEREDLINKRREEKETTTTTTSNPLDPKEIQKTAAAYTQNMPKAPGVPDVNVNTISGQAPGTKIAQGSGQVKGDLPIAEQTVAKATYAQAPEQVKTELAKLFTSQNGVETSLDGMKDIIGKLSPESLAVAAQMKPEELAQLGLTAAQIAQAQTVLAPAARQIQDGEMVDGSAVDQNKVDQAVAGFQAQTADPTKNATVQGQLDNLMQQFEGGNTPAWAAGAIRSANAALAARGLGASSMAGQAVVQAAMEAAVPIAQADAQTYAGFEMQNLNNRQQATMLGAAERAKFLGQEFDQKFQAKVLNAATITSIANQNYSTEVQIALENAKMAQTVDLANLDAKNAKILADAAAMTQLDLANLDNRQKASLQNSQAFLELDMANLDYAQQSEIFKAKARIDAITSDTAARNATSQFNATSQNQANQFFQDLQAQVAQFNATQKNAMEQFNAGESNALSQFKSTQAEQRLQFNAQNRLIVDQSNAEWRRQVTTQNNAEKNERNRLEAQMTSNMSLAEYNNKVQARRDAMNYAFTSGQNSATRATELLIAEMTAATAKAGQKADSSTGLWQAAGSLAAAIWD